MCLAFVGDWHTEGNGVGYGIRDWDLEMALIACIHSGKILSEALFFLTSTTLENGMLFKLLLFSSTVNFCLLLQSCDS